MKQIWRTDVEEGTAKGDSFSIRLCRVDPDDPSSDGALVLRASGYLELTEDPREVEWTVRQVEATELPIDPSELWDRVGLDQWSDWTDGHDRRIKARLGGDNGDESWRQIAPDIWLSVSGG